MKNSYPKNQETAQDFVDILLNRRDQRSECVDQWIESNSSAKQTLENFTDEKRLTDNLNHFYRKNRFEQAQRLHHSIHRKKRVTLIKKMSAVAAILVSVSLVLWWSVDERTETKIALIETAPQPQININRPITTPVLLFQNGSKMALSNDDDVKEIYKGKHIQDSIITVVVPVASDFNLTLPDGTVVRLNAKSRLTFPREFSETERRVEIDGEGFFDVVKGKTPFIVTVNNMEIKVYGTKFNVNSYDHNAIETFLWEGSVGISTPSHPINGEVRLKDNCLSVTDQNGKSVVRIADPNKYLAWIRGFFLFDENSVSKVFEELERRYDVEFVIQCDPKRVEEKIVASFSRDVNIDRILTMINKTTGLRFSQVERRIIVE